MTRLPLPRTDGPLSPQLALDTSTGALTVAAAPVAVTAGSGPRHLIFHPAGTTAFLVNELGSTAATFVYDGATGLLAPAPAYVSTLPTGVSPSGQHAAEILVSPDGTQVYVTNRGPYCGITLFQVMSKAGRLSLSPAGFFSENDPVTNWPRGAALFAAGRFLVVVGERSLAVAVFARDAASGSLTRTATANLTGIVDGPSWVGAYMYS